MNISNLTKTIQAKIAASSDATEIIYLTIALERLNLGLVSVVSTFSNLPSWSNTPGDVAFVDDEQKLYFFYGSWIPIFDAFAATAAFAWGTNNSGQLGDGTKTARSSPVSVIGGFTDWTKISATDIGEGFTAALRANGTAWTWGRNYLGNLGDGTITYRSSPVSVIGGFTDWTDISSGRYHVSAVRANGSAWAWGSNLDGRLGDGTVTSRSSPVSVVGGFTDWTSISASNSHTAALRANGSAWTWGSNNYGRLGDGTVTTRSSPVSVIGGFTDWTDIAAGGTFTAATRENGTAWSWGRNQVGQLGDGTITSKSSPVSVIGGFTDWTAISSGYYHTAALRANGTAFSWGRNSNGRLGDGTITYRSSPVSVLGGFTDWTEISASRSHTAAVRANGSAWAWGPNNSGQLGDGTITSKSSPVSLIGGFTDWTSISAGNGHTAAIKTQ